MQDPQLNARTRAHVHLVLENLQRARSYRSRGAAAALLHARQLNTQLVGVVAPMWVDGGRAVAVISKAMGLKCSVVIDEKDLHHPGVLEASMYGAEILCVDQAKLGDNV